MAAVVNVFLCVMLVGVASPILCSPTPTPTPSNYRIDPATHPYVAPGPGDRRGPCPMLNAFANHGYIPHSGIATPTQLINAAVEVASLAIDVATVLVMQEYAVSGDLLGGVMSIGAPTSDSPTAGGGFDYPGGLNCDASLTRDDYWFNRDASSFNSTKWEAMRAFMEARADPWTAEAMVDFRAIRYNDSLHTNPMFWFSPTALMIQAGAGQFVVRTFAEPDQQATTDTVSSIFVQSKLFPGFGRQTVPVSLPEIAAIGVYWLGKHPMPLSPSNVIFNPPSSPECMMCVWRTAIMNQVPLLSSPLAQGVLNDLLGGPYIQCTAPHCN